MTTHDDDGDITTPTAQEVNPISTNQRADNILECTRLCNKKFRDRRCTGFQSDSHSKTCSMQHAVHSNLDLNEDGIRQLKCTRTRHSDGLHDYECPLIDGRQCC